MTSNKTPDNRLYVHGNGRVLLFHPGRTAISTYYGKVSWVENLKNAAEAEAWVIRQNEILEIERRNMLTRGESDVVLDRQAAWTYRLATEADAQVGK